MFLLGLFLFLLLLLWVRFSVEVELVTEGSKLNSGIRFGFGRLLLPIPPGLLTKTGQRIRERNFTTIEGGLRALKLTLRSMDSLFQRIELLHLEVQIGTGDPFSTSLGVGGLWAIIGSVLATFSSSHRLQSEPEIRIQPDYSQAHIQVYLHCIFQFRVGQIIINELKRVMV